MHKLLPFRQYNENDVINLFQLDVSAATLSSLKPSDATFSKKNWSGTVVVPDSSNDWVADDPGGTHGASHSGDSYLGAIGSADQGNASKWGSFLPSAPMKVAAAGAAAVNCLGITLKPTLGFDENDEKLLYYSVKKDELQCVTPGEAVPVATRGFFTISADALTGSVTVGHGILAGANGTLTAAAISDDDKNIGMVLAEGDRSGDGTTDTYFVQLIGGGRV